MTKDVITISRYWNNPQIATHVSMEGISLSITMEDFITALSTEMGATVTMSTASTAAKLTTCIAKVCERVKEESIKVMV